MNSLPSKRNVPVSFIIALFALIVIAQFLVFASPVHANATTTETTTNEILIVFEVNPDAAGSTVPSGNATYVSGASISILATANSGYAFSGWSVSNASAITIADPSSASTTATVNDFGTITANFSPTTVKSAATQTHVTCDLGSVAAGSSTMCNATVSGGSPVTDQKVSWGSAGTGVFDSSDCTLSEGGTCSVSYMPTEVGDGSHMITAMYAGDASHLNSTDSFTLTVTSGTVIVTTTTTSTAATSGLATVWTDQADYAPVDTPIIYGSGFLPDANITVSVTRPEGIVNTWFTISDGSGGFQTTYATDGLVLGTFNVTATDGTNTATTTFTDAKHSTTTTVSCSPTTTDVGVGVSCTATVTDTDLSPTTPTGTVAWTVPGSAGSFTPTGCTLSVSAPFSCSVTYTPSTDGSATVRGTYSGDGSGPIGHGGSFGTTDVTARRPTTTTVTCSPNPDGLGLQTTCTATVTDGGSGSAQTPTGTVTWTTDTGPANQFDSTSCLLSGSHSTATCQVHYTPSATGSHLITAAYPGDTGPPPHRQSSGSTTLTVNPAADTTAPVITKVIAGTSGTGGWYTSDVTVTWTVTDSESSVVIDSGCGVQPFTSETTGTVSSCIAHSAGGSSSDSVNLKIDNTGPSASLSVTAGTLGLNDWYTSDVTIHASGADAISDSVVCTADQSQTAETAGQVFNGKCTNGAGLSTDAAPLTVKFDKTAPLITVTGTNPITIEVYSSYTDAGATVTDNLDPSITVVSSGSVNSDLVGDCTIYYDAVDAAGNHAVQKSRTVHVTPRPITITADSQTKVYGESDPGLTYKITSGSLHDGDLFTGALTRDAGEDVGTYAITQGSLALNSNYDLTFVGADLTITKANAVISVSGYTGVYDGNAHGASGTATGVKGEDLSSSLDLGSTFTNVPGDTAHWTFTGGTNHNDASGDVAIEISKADAAIVVTPYSVTYDGDPHTATGTATGVKSESLSGLDLSGTTHTNAGTYNSDPWTFTDVTGNYNDASGTVDDNIGQKTASVTPDAKSKTYGDADPLLTGTLDGFLTADNVVASYSRAVGETVLGSPYTISATLSPTEVLSNYDITHNTADFTITTRPITVTADAKSKTYGDADPALTYQTTSGSLAFSDAFTGELSRASGENVGTYAIGQNTLALNDNYVLTYVGANLVIGQKAASVTPNAASKEYSDLDPALTGTLEGFLPADSVTAVYSRTLGETPGTYTISATLSPVGALGNYAITYNTAIFTINKEKVAIEYTGDSFVTTAGPTITTAPVQLSAKLTQEADGHPGDITLAKVTFVLTPTGGGSDITVPDIPVNSAGDALTTKTVKAGVYSVKVTISSGNQYWIESQFGYGPLTVDLGTNDQRVTGGGWISDSLSANGKDNFGFTVYYNKNGAPKGNFLFMFRGTDGYNYQVKSNSWAKGGLSFTSTNTAYFTAKCTIQRIDRITGIAESLGGDYTLVVNIKDGDLMNPKTLDTFAVTIFDSSNNIWKQVGTASSQITLGGGNIVVHSK